MRRPTGPPPQMRTPTYCRCSVTGTLDGKTAGYEDRYRCCNKRIGRIPPSDLFDVPGSVLMQPSVVQKFKSPEIQAFMQIDMHC